METKHWMIDVAAWGTLWGIGTEEEAEQWRQHKASWEGCSAKKREATEEEKQNHKFRDLSKLL